MIIILGMFLAEVIRLPLYSIFVAICINYRSGYTTQTDRYLVHNIYIEGNNDR